MQVSADDPCMTKYLLIENVDVAAIKRHADPIRRKSAVRDVFEERFRTYGAIMRFRYFVAQEAVAIALEDHTLAANARFLEPNRALHHRKPSIMFLWEFPSDANMSAYCSEYRKFNATESGPRPHRGGGFFTEHSLEQKQWEQQSQWEEEDDEGALDPSDQGNPEEFDQTVNRLIDGKLSHEQFMAQLGYAEAEAPGDDEGYYDEEYYDPSPVQPIMSIPPYSMVPVHCVQPVMMVTQPLMMMQPMMVSQPIMQPPPPLYHGSMAAGSRVEVQPPHHQQTSYQDKPAVGAGATAATSRETKLSAKALPFSCGSTGKVGSPAEGVPPTEMDVANSGDLPTAGASGEYAACDSKGTSSSSNAAAEVLTPLAPAVGSIANATAAAAAEDASAAATAAPLASSTDAGRKDAAERPSATHTLAAAATDGGPSPSPAAAAISAGITESTQHAVGDVQRHQPPPSATSASSEVTENQQEWPPPADPEAYARGLSPEGPYVMFKGQLLPPWDPQVQGIPGGDLPDDTPIVWTEKTLKAYYDITGALAKNAGLPYPPRPTASAAVAPDAPSTTTAPALAVQSTQGTQAAAASAAAVPRTPTMPAAVAPPQIPPSPAAARAITSPAAQPSQQAKPPASSAAGSTAAAPTADIAASMLLSCRLDAIHIVHVTTEWLEKMKAAINAARMVLPSDKFAQGTHTSPWR